MRLLWEIQRLPVSNHWVLGHLVSQGLHTEFKKGIQMRTLYKEWFDCYQGYSRINFYMVLQDLNLFYNYKCEAHGAVVIGVRPVTQRRWFKHRRKLLIRYCSQTSGTTYLEITIKRFLISQSNCGWRNFARKAYFI